MGLILICPFPCAVIYHTFIVNLQPLIRLGHGGTEDGGGRDAEHQMLHLILGWNISPYGIPATGVIRNILETLRCSKLSQGTYTGLCPPRIRGAEMHRRVTFPPPTVLSHVECKLSGAEE